jgi:carotenoid cleavage dioxygenase-like enzyme
MSGPHNTLYLQGGFAPIGMESNYHQLQTNGHWPDHLKGTLYRIGPNPQFHPRGQYNPLMGDGMVHAFFINDAKIAYKNRWIRTEQWHMDRKAGRALFATSGNPLDSDESVMGKKTNGVANTHLVRFNNKLLALEESHRAIEIDPGSLNTLSSVSIGAQSDHVCAHPRIDAVTGELFSFANYPSGVFDGKVALDITNRQGEVTHSRIIEGPFPAVVHDFVVTDNFIVIPFCPLTIRIERARVGQPVVAWEPELGTQIAVIHRHNSAAPVRWFKTQACMVWHIMNAWDDGEKIALTVCQQSAPAIANAEGVEAPLDTTQQYLRRWLLDYSNHQFVSSTKLWDSACEYPRVDERFAGKNVRHGFVACCGGPGTGDLFHRGIGHYDFTSAVMDVYAFEKHMAVSEPVFVPNEALNEGVGYLLCTVYDEQRDRSHLALFDSVQVGKGPIATAYLEHRLPLGFHGIWCQT